MSVATPDLPQDSVPVTLRSSGGGHSRGGHRTCARWPGPSPFPGPRGPGKRWAVSSSLPPPAEGRQCRGSCPRPGERRAPRPDWNSTQDVGTRGDSPGQGMLLPPLSRLVRAEVTCGQADHPPSLCWSWGPGVSLGDLL